MTLEQSWRTGQWPSLEWNEDDGVWIGEWHVEETDSHQLIRVSKEAMDKHVRGWRQVDPAVSHAELRSVSAWLTTYNLWREAGKSLPGVTVTKLSK